MAASRAVWAAIEAGRVEGLIAAHGLMTIHYLVGREHNRQVARRCVETLLRVFGVAAVGEPVVRSALTLSSPDFEDAVTAAAAQTTGCDVIVTRDPTGFPDSPVPVLDPTAAGAWLLQS